MYAGNVDALHLHNTGVTVKEGGPRDYILV